MPFIHRLQQSRAVIRWILNLPHRSDVSAFMKHSTIADPRDIALSYTTYPDKEHIVDNRKTPIIFSHGLFGAKGNLHSVSKHLSNDGREVITYDARNHGDSDHSPDFTLNIMAGDLTGLISDLNLSQPICMGHSMGGKTAMTLALNNPESIKALIVVDVTPDTSPNGQAVYDYAVAMQKTQIPNGASIVQARKEVQMQLEPVVTNRNMLQFLLTNLRQADDGKIKWRMNLDSFINNRMDIIGFPALEGKTFDKPTLFVFGGNSEHYKSPGFAKIKDYFPQSEVKVVPATGHFVHSEKPLDFVNIVKAFCDSIDSTR